MRLAIALALLGMLLIICGCGHRNRQAFYDPTIHECKVSTPWFADAPKGSDAPETFTMTKHHPRPGDFYEKKGWGPDTCQLPSTRKAV